MKTYGAIHWAYNSPGCFIWARVLDNGRVFIQSDLKFVHKPPEVVAAEVKQRSAMLGVRLSAVYGLPEMFPKPRPEGTTAHSRPLEAEAPSQTFARFGLPMVAAGGNRVHGWQRIHDFLRDAPDGKPWLIVAPECQWLIRTIPSLVQTKTDPDDCEGEEYAVNALRALLASRPQPTQEVKKPTVYPYLSLGWLKQQGKTPARGVLSR